MRFLTFLSIFFLFFPFSCQQTGFKTNAVKINIVSDPNTLDPRKTRSVQERTLVNMLFEGLTRASPSGQPELALAQEVQMNEDGTLYTFTLKEAYWSNGDRISSKDFLYTWQKTLDPGFPSSNAYQLFCIKEAKEIKQGKKPMSDLGVIAVDDKTLQIQLEHPVSYFLELLSFSIFFPIHEKMDRKGLDWNIQKQGLIGSGPFRIKQWLHNDVIEIVKNEKYWDEQAVRLSSIEMVMVEKETEIQMFENRELDWAGSPISGLPLSVVGEKKGKDLFSAPMMGTAFFRVNVETPPLNNVYIRRALSYAINRQEIVDHILQGGQRTALRLVPDTADSFFADADEEKARMLFFKGLREEGYSYKTFPKISLFYASDDKNHLLAQAVQQCWKRALGIEVALEVNEPKVYYQRIAKQDYQIAIGSWIGDYNDPETFLEVFKYKSASTNNTQWENAAYTKLLDISRTLMGETRKEVLYQCEALLLQEMPIIPIYHFKSLYLKNKNLKNVFVSSLGNLDFKWAYFEEESHD